MDPEAFAAQFRGQPLPEQVVVVERGPVSGFATAILDADTVRHDATAATDAGFDAIPAPPTWPIAMATFGAFRELQPAATSGPTPVEAAIGTLMSGGGLILHGEQEFTYHRPIVVGDVLRGAGEIEDVYVKESGGKRMTFVVARTDWTEADTGTPVCSARMTVIHRV